MLHNTPILLILGLIAFSVLLIPSADAHERNYYLPIHSYNDQENHGRVFFYFYGNAQVESMTLTPESGDVLKDIVSSSLSCGTNDNTDRPSFKPTFTTTQIDIDNTELLTYEITCTYTSDKHPTPVEYLRTISFHATPQDPVPSEQILVGYLWDKYHPLVMKWNDELTSPYTAAQVMEKKTEIDNLILQLPTDPEMEKWINITKIYTDLRLYDTSSVSYRIHSEYSFNTTGVPYYTGMIWYNYLDDEISGEQFEFLSKDYQQIYPSPIPVESEIERLSAEEERIEAEIGSIEQFTEVSDKDYDELTIKEIELKEKEHDIQDRITNLCYEGEMHHKEQLTDDEEKDCIDYDQAGIR